MARIVTKAPHLRTERVSFVASIDAGYSRLRPRSAPPRRGKRSAENATRFVIVRLCPSYSGRPTSPDAGPDPKGRPRDAKSPSCHCRSTSPCRRKLDGAESEPSHSRRRPAHDGRRPGAAFDRDHHEFICE
jgi:hypothetical protein